MIVFVVAGVVVVLAFLIWKGTRRVKMHSAERQLGRMVGADAAERLIRWEMLREPGMSRATAAQRALERAEYDRGR